MNLAKPLIIGTVIVVALVLLLLVSGTFYVIDESEQAVITQFGKIIGEPITESGLHMKMPFVQDANYFDKRLLDWEGEKTVSKTKEQKFISVEVYARWRIINPKLFLQTVAGRIETAQSRLDATIDPIVRDVIAENSLTELVRSDTEKAIYERILKGTQSGDDGAYTPQREETTEETVQEDRDSMNSIYEEREIKIEKGRSFITTEIFNRSKDEVSRFGIELADVRIKRINYRPETRRQVYNRMIAERKREEALYISEGERSAAEITGSMERELQQIESEGDRRVLEINGDAEARSIEIFADAYNRNPELYQFLKTLEALKATVDKETWLILSTDSELYKILKDIERIR